MSEVKIISWNFPPQGWAFCNGAFLPINQNQALFSLLGTTYGGNGQTNFALPDLRGRGPIHFGAGQGLSFRQLGERSGEEAHTLSTSQLPAHTHVVNVANMPGTQATPAANYFAANRGGYASAGDVAMHSGAVTNAGGFQAHQNLAPLLTLSFCIALQGIFPSPN